MRARAFAASLALACVAAAAPSLAGWPDTGGVLPLHASARARRVWAVGQSGLCLLATASAERRHGLPPGTLGAVSRVETGLPMPVTGDVEPWPWTINAGGVGRWYATRAEAARVAASLLARTAVDVDVGCMQVSLRYHRRDFATLADAFDPARNAELAASLLGGLVSRHGLAAATGRYHSATPSLAAPYRADVGRMRRTQRRTLADARAVAP